MGHANCFVSLSSLQTNFALLLDVAYKFRIVAVYTNDQFTVSPTTSKVVMPPGNPIPVGPPERAPRIVSVRQTGDDVLVVTWFSNSTRPVSFFTVQVSIPYRHIVHHYV